MEQQTKINQSRGYTSQNQPPYPKGQYKKNLVNFPKSQNYQRPQRSPPMKTSQYNYQQKSVCITLKSQRPPLMEKNINVAPKPPRFGGNDKILDVNKYLENINHFMPFKRLNQTTTVSTYPEKIVQITELSGFRIVQNGIIIHDETSDGKEFKRNETSVTTVFSFEDKFKPHTESVLTLSPCSKLIPLPTFIEAQE